jgi:hypothetical protein
VSAETPAIAALTFLAVTLMLNRKPALDEAAASMVATAIGTVVARRYAAEGDAVERTLRRATIAALVASIAFLVLLGLTRATGAVG